MRELVPTLDEFASAPVAPLTDVPACEVCGGTDVERFAGGYDYELRTCRNEWQFVACRACTHVWLHPRPSVEALDLIYPPTYYSYHYDKISPIARRGKELLDAAKLRTILNAYGSTPRRYLDVGCGDGRYLEVLAKKGVDRGGLFGLELDETVVERLRERGLQAYCERVESCAHFEPASFDLITMFHVIEHVESPAVVLDKLASWLAPGGILAVETPNLDSLDARLFGDGTWGGFHIPRHWHLFRPATLARLVESTGLDVEATRFTTGHSFWMYSLHHRLRYGRRPRPRLARWFNPLESVLPLVAFTGFDRVRSLVGAKTSAMLVLARKPG